MAMIMTRHRTMTVTMVRMERSLAHAARRAARRLGTPLYLYDRPRLRADALALRAAFPDPWLRLYALKANGLPNLLADLPGLGYGASVVSHGELHLAERAGFATTAVALEGVGKDARDLSEVVRLARSGRALLWTSLESTEEAAALARLAGRAQLREPLDVLVRINPGVQPETHHGLAVGAAGSKFGILPEELPEVIEAGGGAHGPLRWRGIHVHVGSQLGRVDAWRSAFRVALRLLLLQRAALPDFDTLDAGSGFPVAYGQADSVPDAEHFARAAHEELERIGGDLRPRLAVEPGRAVVAQCGWLVSRVLHVRHREPPAVVLDAGMTELVRPVLYGAEHPVVALTSRGRPVDGEGDAQPRRRGPPRLLQRLHGPVCEAVDRLGEALLPPLRRGDVVAIGLVGAYGSSMASTYNGRPRPPEVAWGGDAAGLTLLRRRGSRSALP